MILINGLSIHLNNRTSSDEALVVLRGYNANAESDGSTSEDIYSTDSGSAYDLITQLLTKPPGSIY